MNAPDQSREAVILWQGDLWLTRFPTADTSLWGLDVNAVPWSPTKDDKQGIDWEIHELWS